MDIEEIKLLVADADVSVREIILYALKEQGWEADQARDGVAAIKLLRRNRYRLLIIDMDLPVIDGITVCEQFCANTPVIFISRRDSEQDRLDAFEAGGNDFVVKPFYPRELIARVKSLLKLTGGYKQETNLLYAGGLSINMSSRDVIVNEKQVRLTPREYDLLLFFAQHERQSFTRETLLDMVWGQRFDGSDRTVDTHVKSLREKLKPCHTHIKTIWGYGYKFVANPENLPR